MCGATLEASLGRIGNKRKRPVSDSDIIGAYRQAHSVYVVERDLGVAASTILRVLERHGVERDGLARYRSQSATFTLRQSREIRQAYESGASFADLIARFGGTFQSVKSAIKRGGGTLVPVTPRMTKAEQERCLELYRSGVSQMRISLKMGRSQSLISRTLKKAGCIPRRRAGSDHPLWKGGRWKKKSGYVMVRLDKESPLASMADGSGYVLEHRYVMAQALGRPLDQSETVHHINGKCDDNCLENLQLRSGRHGKGHAMVCLDCGSHNVGHAPIGAGVTAD